MELLNNWINGVNDILWSYILIIMLLGCAVWFTIKSRFVQFRMIGEMIRLLGRFIGFFQRIRGVYVSSII